MHTYLPATHLDCFLFARNTMRNLEDKFGKDIPTNLCKKIRDVVKFNDDEQIAFSQLIKDVGFAYEGCMCREGKTHPICNFAFNLSDEHHRNVALFLMELILYNPHEDFYECGPHMEEKWDDRVNENTFVFGDMLLAAVRGEKVNLAAAYSKIEHCGGIACTFHVMAFVMLKDAMFSAYAAEMLPVQF